jgi:5'/3'-nucleotidase
VHILISNDDGYLAPGLFCLAEALQAVARISVVVPDRDRSGASNSLTLENPIRAMISANNFIRVNGTPTDCVHLAITGLLEDEPDMVISGINAGANLGDDILYSGTVAAAMEGRFLGLPAMAVSLAGKTPENYDTAVKVVLKLIERLQTKVLANDVILNVNVPDVPVDQLKGLAATRLGHRHRSEPVIKDTDPQGRVIYWVGPSGPEQDAGPGTDFYAINNHCVSVTPLHIDLTRHTALEITSDWLREVKLS